MRTAVQARSGGLTRRAVLGVAGAGAAAILGGCDSGGDKPTPPPAPDPLTALLGGTVALADRYDAAIAAHSELADRLTAIRDDHRAHAAALAAEIHPPNPNPSPTTPDASAPAASDPAALLADLRTAEQAGHTDAVAACVATTSRRAALVGSIAACRATHLEALK